MPRAFRPSWGKLVSLVLIWLALTLNFQTNLLGIAQEEIFATWQLNGQSRVLGRIIAERDGLDLQGAGMGYVYKPEQLNAPNTNLKPDQIRMKETYRVYEQGITDPSTVIVQPYRAQYGLHAGIMATFGQNASLQTLQLVTAGLTALVLVLLTQEYLCAFDRRFAILFILCLAIAPYFLSMARNLYWSPYLLLLPALLAAWFYRDRAALRRRWMWLALIGAAVFLKSASNYEYLTSVTLMACAVFIVAPTFRGERPDLGTAARVFVACVAGFAVALLLHAGARSDTVIEGLRAIWVEDIARRTYGDPALQTQAEARASLEASPLDVLRIYLYEAYPGKRTMIMPGKIFLALIALSLGGIALKGALRHPHFQRDFVTFAMFFAVPASWFIFAKGHAYTQTHINFVLWYLGFMPALLYVSWSTLTAAPEMLRSLLWRLRT